MRKQYRVKGTVPYTNDKGWRLTIPTGQTVEVEEVELEHDGMACKAVMTWTDLEGRQWKEYWQEVFWAQYVYREMAEI